ncbi:unnamed protein product [Sphenostylis stenocarpa]|uniref:Uncharacterized protein n=1 Tax=Sphenostylis stenocarpa TaxID=92480 RepID=A0AA86SNQ5_9FABA|nr:unnamed protein product [Sphenostylis stenocarpa]
MCGLGFAFLRVEAMFELEKGGIRLQASKAWGKDLCSIRYQGLGSRSFNGTSGFKKLALARFGLEEPRWHS